MKARIFAEFEAIGTHWWIGVYGSLAETSAQRLSEDLQKLAADFDQAYSRFLPDSLITQLNDNGRLQGFPEELYQMIQLGEKLRRQSDGVFNLGVGRQLEELGYDADYSFAEKSLPPPLATSVFKQLDSDLIQLQVGARVDLGGLGKGWLIDKMVGLMESRGVPEFFVNGGGDIRTAGQTKKTFAIENPLDPSQAIGELKLTTGAVAASAANKRAWQAVNTGRRHHHLIQPATGRSHDGPAGVYTYAPTAMQADTASTILFLTSPDKVERLAEKLGVQYLVVTQAGKAFSSADYPAALY